MGISASMRRAAQGYRRAHSTMDPDTLMHHAEMAQSKLWSFSLALAEIIGSDPSTQVIRGPLKLRDRLETKVIKYGGNYSMVHDLVRNRILHKSKDEIIALRSITGPGKNTHPFLIEWAERGVHIVEIDDAYLKRKKSGCVGVNLSIGIDLGKGRWHVAEANLMHEGMQSVDAKTRFNYDEYIRPVTDIAELEGRDLTDEEAAQIAPFRQANRELYNGGLVANNLAGLLSKDEFNFLLEDIHAQRLPNIEFVNEPLVRSVRGEPTPLAAVA